MPGGEVQGQDGLEEEGQGEEEEGFFGKEGEEAQDPSPKPDPCEEEGPAVQPVQEEAGEEVQGQGEVGRAAKRARVQVVPSRPRRSPRPVKARLPRRRLGTRRKGILSSS